MIEADKVSKIQEAFNQYIGERPWRRVDHPGREVDSKDGLDIETERA